MEVNYRIPDNIIYKTFKDWGRCIINSEEAIVKYMYENNVLIHEWKRRIRTYQSEITDDICGPTIDKVIDFLSGVKKDATLDLCCGEVTLVYTEPETDAEWAQRLYYNVFHIIDQKLEKAKNKKEDLIKEKKDLEARLKQINSLLNYEQGTAGQPLE